MATAQIEIPPKLVKMFSKPLGSYRYRCAYGGRGSAKSRTFALMAAVYGFSSKLRVLCVREFHTSIRESFYAELKSAIEANSFLAAHYEIGAEYIRGKNGTEFFFKGLYGGVGSIKSISGIDLTIAEEAEDISDEAWTALEPTIFRQKNSELWVIWNPCREGSPVDMRFRKNPPEKSIVVKVNWQDNPFFPAALNDLRKREQQRLDAGMYAWIWDGEYNTRSDAQVLNGKWRVAEFTPASNWDGAYFGADWGFSQDPTTLVKCWINDGVLYIQDEVYEVGLEISHTAQAFKRVDGAERSTIYADSARPETISHVNRDGLRVVPVKKGAGSVEDGIAFLRSFREIVIHPRCRHTINEARLYSYKTDRLTKDIKPDIIDTNNHCIDALRYALEPIMRHKKQGIIQL